MTATDILYQLAIVLWPKIAVFRLAVYVYVMLDNSHL